MLKLWTNPKCCVQRRISGSVTVYRWLSCMQISLYIFTLSGLSAIILFGFPYILLGIVVPCFRLVWLVYRSSFAYDFYLLADWSTVHLINFWVRTWRSGRRYTTKVCQVSKNIDITDYKNLCAAAFVFLRSSVFLIIVFVFPWNSSGLALLYL